MPAAIRRKRRGQQLSLVINMHFSSTRVSCQHIYTNEVTHCQRCPKKNKQTRGLQRNVKPKERKRLYNEKWLQDVLWLEANNGSTELWCKICTDTIQVHLIQAQRISFIIIMIC